MSVHESSCVLNAETSVGSAQKSSIFIILKINFLDQSIQIMIYIILTKDAPHERCMGYSDPTRDLLMYNAPVFWLKFSKAY